MKWRGGKGGGGKNGGDESYFLPLYVIWNGGGIEAIFSPLNQTGLVGKGTPSSSKLETESQQLL